MKKSNVRLSWSDACGCVKEYTTLVGLARVHGQFDLKRAHGFYRKSSSFEGGMTKLRAKLREIDNGGVEEAKDSGSSTLPSSVKKGGEAPDGMTPIKLEKETLMKMRWWNQEKGDTGGKAPVNPELLEGLDVFEMNEEQFKAFCAGQLSIHDELKADTKRRNAAVAKMKKEQAHHKKGRGGSKRRKVTKSSERAEPADVEERSWQHTSWNADSICSLDDGKCVRVHRASMVVYGMFILCLLLPSDERLRNLDALSERIRAVKGNNKGFVREGMRDVTRGDGKDGSGTMLMGGAHVAQTNASTVERREYAAGAKEDEVLRALMEEYVMKEALPLEQSDVPAVSYLRNKAIKESDPLGLHSFVSEDGHARTYAFSWTSSYVVPGHEDTEGYPGVTESIFLSSTGIDLPEGHEWLFTCASLVFRLDEHKSCRIYVPSTMWHGTLPTSSIENTYDHGGVGSALVLKNDMVKMGLETPYI
jgi:hypothetical protein